MGQYISVWTDKKPGFMHFSTENRNFQFPRMRHKDKSAELLFTPTGLLVHVKAERNLFSENENQNK